MSFLKMEMMYIFLSIFPLTTCFLHCIKKINNKKIIKKKTILMFSYIPTLLLFCSKFKYEFYLNSNYFFKTQIDFFFFK